jgi:tRNA 2-thiouridine synthesizing protein A
VVDCVRLRSQLYLDVGMEKTDFVVDASGESCPMPLLRAKMQLNKMKAGETVKVVATDAGSVRDFEAFIKLTSNTLSTQHGSNEFVFFITKND